MNDIEKLFVPYKQSLELKELGFNGNCFGFYNEKLELWGVNPISFYAKNSDVSWNCKLSNIFNKSAKDKLCTAPIFSQAFEFFRDKYKWEQSVDATKDQHNFKLGYNYWVWNNKTGEEYHTEPQNRPKGDWEYETYEEAELECLKRLIQLVKTNEKDNK